MARESERVALLRRKLGTRLQLARSAAGLTQDQLAVAAFRDRTTVAHIEKGRLRADERFWTAADRACGTDGALVAAYAEVQATKASEELAQHKAALADAQAQLDRLNSLGAASDRADAENRALARLDAALADVPSAWAALEWLDRAAGWAPGAARRAVAARFASVDVGQLRDQSVHRSRVGQSQVAEVLRSYYGGTVDGYGTYGVTVDGVTVGTSVVTRPEWLDLGCVLSSRTDRLRFSASLSAPAVRLDEFGAERAVDRLAETLAIDTRLIDLPLYWLAELDVSGGKVAGQLGVTQFAHFGLTLDLLEGELFGAIVSGSPDMLPLRDKYLPDLSSVVDFSRRLCVGGAVAVCAIARPSGPYGQADYLILAQRRSSHVVNAARRLALIPRGFHQPLADQREDARIRVTVLREMEEELFGRDDVDNTSGDQRCADPMHPSRLSEPMSWLLDHADRLRLECTGIGLNTVNGNYDLACLIVIEDEQFWSRFGGLIEANWESSSLHRYSSRDPESIAELITDEAWTVDGPFALTQGLRRLATISSGDRTDLPDITRSLT